MSQQISRKMGTIAALLRETPPPAPKRWECKTITHCTDEQLAAHINDGWEVQLQQFVPLHGQIVAGKASVALCVVLRRQRSAVQPVTVPPAPKRVTPTHVELKQVVAPSYDMNISYAEALERRYPAPVLREIGDNEAKAVFVASMERSQRERAARPSLTLSICSGI